MEMGHGFTEAETEYTDTYGKKICNYLKMIRQKTADENQIDYHSEECSNTGNCSGTCPKCEEELRFLSNKLEQAEKEGKQIRIPFLSIPQKIKECFHSILPDSFSSLQSISETYEPLTGCPPLTYYPSVTLSVTLVDRASGQEYKYEACKESFTVGANRGMRADIQIADNSISTVHLRFYWDQNNDCIDAETISSINPSYINGKVIMQGMRVPVRQNDVIHIGNSDLTFYYTVQK